MNENKFLRKDISDEDTNVISKLHSSGIIVTSWHGNAFRITGPLWGNPSVTSGFPSHSTSHKIFVIVCLNRLMNKHSSFPWFEILWHSCDITVFLIILWNLTRYGGHSYDMSHDLQGNILIMKAFPRFSQALLIWLPNLSRAISAALALCADFQWLVQVGEEM